MSNLEIIKKYTNDELTLEEANAKLKGIKLDPGKNVLTEEEKRATTIGCYADMANGWGLLDQGIPPMQKVKVENGKLIGCDMGEAFALCFIGGRMYEVENDTLV